MTLSEPRPYKKHTKKEGSIYSKKGGELYTWRYLHLHQLFKFWSYVDKNHMNNHYFHCSHLNKLKIKTKNNKKIQH